MSTRRKTPPPEDFPSEQDTLSIITGTEAAEVLRICDKSQRSFADFIGRSPNFVRGPKVLGAVKYVRLQWVRALRSFVSEEDYVLALSVIRQRQRLPR